MNQLNKYIFYMLILLSITNYEFTCGNCENAVSGTFKFPMGESITQNTYQLGDTIVLKVPLNSVFQLKGGGEYFNRFEPLSVQFDVLKVAANNERTFEGIRYFEIISNIGTFVPNSDINKDFRGKLEWMCDGDSCRLDIRFISLAKGYYAFASLNGDLSYNECNAYIATEPTLSEGRDNNFGICGEIGTDKLIVNINNQPVPILDVARRNNYYFFRVI